VLKFSLKARSLATALILTLLTITVMASAGIYYVQTKDADELHSRLFFIADLQAKALSDSIWNINDAAVENLLRGLINDDDFQYAEIRDPEGKTLASEGIPPSEEASEYLSAIREIKYTEYGEIHTLGVIEISFSLERLEQSFQNLMLGGFFAAFIVLAVVGGVIMVSFGMMTGPIERISKVMAELAKGDLEVELTDLDREDEIGKMANAVKIFRDNAVEAKTTSATIFSALQRAQTVEEFSSEAVRKLTPMLKGGYGAFHVYDETTKQLTLKGVWGFEDKNPLGKVTELGQGIAGQCALEQRVITVDNIPEDYTKITFASRKQAPKEIFVLPVVHMDRLQGVIEIASLYPFLDAQRRMVDNFIPTMALSLENLLRSIRAEEQVATLNK
jgi:HAMP domain-containing protein